MSNHNDLPSDVEKVPAVEAEKALSTNYKWYAVQAISNQEKKVKKTIEESRDHKGMTDLVVDVLVPIENVAEVKGGEQKVSEKRIWPGYIFVKMILNDDSWMFIKNTNGVIDFLGGAKPMPLQQKEIDAILADLEEKNKGVVQKHDIHSGDKVKIVDGVFANFSGFVNEVFQEKGRLSVKILIFGRETDVTLEFWQVEKILQD